MHVYITEKESLFEISWPVFLWNANKITYKPVRKQVFERPPLYFLSYMTTSLEIEQKHNINWDMACLASLVYETQRYTKITLDSKL